MVQTTPILVSGLGLLLLLLLLLKARVRPGDLAFALGAQLAQVRVKTADDPAAAGLHAAAEVLDIRAAGLHHPAGGLSGGLGEGRRGQGDDAGGQQGA
jgi:hypothetical protein